MAAFAVNEGSAGQAVMKIHGRLVKLAAQRSEAGEFVLSEEGMSVQIKPVTTDGDARPIEERKADMLFELEQGLRVGYSGWFRCDEKS